MPDCSTNMLATILIMIYWRSLWWRWQHHNLLVWQCIVPQNKNDQGLTKQSHSMQFTPIHTHTNMDICVACGSWSVNWCSTEDNLGFSGNKQPLLFSAFFQSDMRERLFNCVFFCVCLFKTESRCWSCLQDPLAGNLYSAVLFFLSYPVQLPWLLPTSLHFHYFLFLTSSSFHLLSSELFSCLFRSFIFFLGAGSHCHFHHCYLFYLSSPYHCLIRSHQV